MADDRTFKKQIIAKIYQLYGDGLGQLSSFKKHPVLIAGVISLIFVGWIMNSANKDDLQQHDLQIKPIDFESDSDQMVGIKESVVAEDVWTAKVERRVDSASKELGKKMSDMESLANNNELEVSKMKEELALLKQHLKEQKEATRRKEFEDNLMRNNAHNKLSSAQQKSKRTLGSFSKTYDGKKRNIKWYLPSGSFARAVLETGVVVGTGTNSQANPEPIKLRLTDVGRFTKGLRIDQIKEAILLGDCTGNLSSERAKCRIQTLSLENNKGEIIERKVEGWIIGEDGRYGIKGMVVDKSSDLLRMAMLNGVLGGVSSFLQSQATKGAYPISPITGQQNALSGISQLKAGMAHGSGDAFTKIADFIMDRFNSMSPEIVIASGREVDVVFKNGVDLNGEFNSDLENAQKADGNLRQNNQHSDSNEPRYINYDTGENLNAQQPQYMNYGSGAFNETMQQMDSGINKGGHRDGF